MKIIVARLPDYIINKWADVSYSNREKGQNPKLKDLAQFVKRQAVIKNDPGFAGVSLVISPEVKGNRTKSLKVNNRSFIPEPTRQTFIHETATHPLIEVVYVAPDLTNYLHASSFRRRICRADGTL